MYRNINNIIVISNFKLQPPFCLPNQLFRSTVLRRRRRRLHCGGDTAIIGQRAGARGQQQRADSTDYESWRWATTTTCRHVNVRCSCFPPSLSLSLSLFFSYCTHVCNVVVVPVFAAGCNFMLCHRRARDFALPPALGASVQNDYCPAARARTFGGQHKIRAREGEGEGEERRKGKHSQVSLTDASTIFPFLEDPPPLLTESGMAFHLIITWLYSANS